MKQITPPPFGLTLQAPGGALIAWGNKDIENRRHAVATSIGDYRGRVALTASAGHSIGASRLSFGTAAKPNQRVMLDIKDTMEELDDLVVWRPAMVPKYRDIIEMAGHWFATARIADVLPPTTSPTGWRAGGQYGIVLRDVEVLPEYEPASGGRGFYEFARCATCARPVAKGSLHRCKETR